MPLRLPAIVMLLILTCLWQEGSTQPIAPKEAAGPRSRLYDLANTASQEAYLSESEKTVILLCNLARLDGPYFVQNYLHFYRDTTHARFVSLKHLLLRQPPLHPLRPAFGLSRSASIHAQDMGTSGLTGTASSEGQHYKERIHMHLPEATGYASTFYLGSGDPLDVVLGLLVGEEDSLLVYRRSILSPYVDYLGVSIKPHKLQCSNTVIDFARRPMPRGGEAASAQKHKKSELYWMDCPKSTKVISRHRPGRKGWWPF